MDWGHVAMIGLVVVVMGGGLSFLMSLLNSIGMAFKDLFGLADAMENMFKDQLDSCKQKGYFNIKDGCIIGFAGIAVIGWYTIMLILKTADSFSKWRVGQNRGRTGEIGNKIIQLLGDNAIPPEDVDDARKAANKVAEEGGSEVAQELAAREVIKRKSLRRAMAEAANASDDVRNAYNEAVQEAAEDFQECEEPLESDDQKHVRNAEDEGFIPPPPEPIPKL